MILGNIYPLTILGALATVYGVQSANLESSIVNNRSATLATQNGIAKGGSEGSILAKVVHNQKLELGGGWFKFFFAQAGTETAYTFTFDYSDYIQISITDAYCPGDAFDLYKDGKYLLTTPRVLSDGCKTSVADPNVAFLDPRWSSTKFMLPGKFNMSIWVKDSPYSGGAAFIRADKRLAVCTKTVSPFTLVTEPLSTFENAAQTCSRVGGVPAHIKPNNALAAAQTLLNCTASHLAWFGQLSLASTKKLGKDLGCLAFNGSNIDDPTVSVVDCNTKLPTLCLPA